jgi:uncharacterized protein (DUF697 family)/tellurite resistance protein
MMPAMNDQERNATLAIAVMAALADGVEDEREHAELARIAASLHPASASTLATLVQEIKSGTRTPEAEAAALTSPEARRLAFELAVGVCNADGLHGEPEAKFLERLRAALGLDATQAALVTKDATALVTTPLANPGAPAGAGRPVPDDAALDQVILDAAILNGALELLPHSLATLAIVPLQMRLVYRIGEAHGYALDAGHVKDFLATAGLGLASQYLEQVGRKLVGGLLGALTGRLIGGLAGVAAGSAVAFASTYALGEVAKRYYGGGRTLTAVAVREAFQTMLAKGQGLAQRYSGAIEDQARTLDVSQLASLVRGGS